MLHLFFHLYKFVAILYLIDLYSKLGFNFMITWILSTYLLLGPHHLESTEMHYRLSKCLRSGITVEFMTHFSPLDFYV